MSGSAWEGRMAQAGKVNWVWTAFSSRHPAWIRIGIQVRWSSVWVGFLWRLSFRKRINQFAGLLLKVVIPNFVINPFGVEIENQVEGLWQCNARLSIVGTSDEYKFDELAHDFSYSLGSNHLASRPQQSQAPGVLSLEQDQCSSCNVSGLTCALFKHRVVLLT